MTWIPAALLALSLRLDAAPAGQGAAEARLYRSEELRFEAELPAGWKARGGPGELRPESRPEPAAPLGIDASFRPDPEADAQARLKAVAAPTEFQRKSRRIKSFSGGRIQRRGPWLTVEIREVDEGGAEQRAVHAVLPVRGGFYEAVYFGSGASFDGARAGFERFLDSFRRTPPALGYDAYEDPQGRFRLSLPKDWTVSRSSAEGELRVVGPGAPGSDSPALMAISGFRYGERYPDAEAFVREVARGGAGTELGPVVSRSFPAGGARIVELKTRLDGRALPERWTGRNFHFQTSYAVFAGEKGFWVLRYSAPPSVYPDYLPAFNRALDTLRISPS